MSEQTLDELLGEEGEAVIAAVRERMKGDAAMSRVAAQRGLRDGDLLAQVLGFWLEAIRSDLTLGSCDGMRQSLQWLVSLRSGHAVPFEDELVGRVFRDICAEIEARLATGDQRALFAAYRDEVWRIIAETFPG